MADLTSLGGSLTEKKNAANLKLAQMRRQRDGNNGFQQQNQSQRGGLTSGLRQMGMDGGNLLRMQQNRRPQQPETLEKKARKKAGKMAGSWAGGALMGFLLPVVGAVPGKMVGGKVGEKLAGSTVGKWVMWGIVAGIFFQYVFLIGTLVIVIMMIINNSSTAVAVAKGAAGGVLGDIIFEGVKTLGGAFKSFFK